MVKRKPRERRSGGGARGQRGRGAAGTLWLYGVHPVLHALANRARRCRRLLLTPEASRSLGARLEAAVAARVGEVAAAVVARAEIDARLPPHAAHQGIALEAEPLAAPRLEAMRERLAAESAAAVVALDRVTDPRNVGAVLRAAAAFGARAVIVPERHAPPVTGALAKAAAGALELVPLVRVVNLARALAALKQDGFWCLGLDPGAERRLAEALPREKVVLVLGAEGAGLRRLTRESCDLLAAIPLAGGVESLNVAAAAAVALYELRRRQ